PPLSYKNEQGQWDGFSIELFDALAVRLDLDYTLQGFDSFNGLISATKAAKVDLSAANITITSAREKEMDFSQPILDSGLRILVRKTGEEQSVLRLILKSGVLWFFLGSFMLLLIVAHLLWFYERFAKPGQNHYFSHHYVDGVWDAFWWAFISITMGSFEKDVPPNKLSRLLAMFWVIASLFFISTLTAKMTSAMTVSKLYSSISGYQDLERKKVGVINSAPTIKFIQEKVGVKPIVYEQYSDLYVALKNKQLDAIVGDAPIVSYYASHEGKAFIKAVGESFKPEKYGLLYPEKSKFKESIDRALLEMKESGEYLVLHEKYFKE
ncbi:MAG: transporter substrate-binding domain-containing protein, partial [Arenicellales bacterium]